MRSGSLFDRVLFGPAAPESPAGGQLKTNFASVCDFLLKRAEAKQQEIFRDAYRQEANKKLGGPLGFPLVKAQSSILTLEKLKEAEKQLFQVSRDLQDPAAQAIFTGGNEAWLKFATRATNLYSMAQAILGKEGIPGECMISLMKSEENTPAADKLPGKWRDIELICGGATKGKARNPSQADQEMGTVRTDEELTLKLIRSANELNSKTSPYPVGKWGALALLLQPNVQMEEDRLAWKIHLPLKEEDGGGAIPLKLKFERRLPKLEDWPPN